MHVVNTVPLIAFSVAFFLPMLVLLVFVVCDLRNR